jgi:hypothetical protein
LSPRALSTSISPQTAIQTAARATSAPAGRAMTDGSTMDGATQVSGFSSGTFSGFRDPRSQPNRKHKCTIRLSRPP